LKGELRLSAVPGPGPDQARGMVSAQTRGEEWYRPRPGERNGRHQFSPVHPVPGQGGQRKFTDYQFPLHIECGK